VIPDTTIKTKASGKPPDDTVRYVTLLTYLLTRQSTLFQSALRSFR